MHVSLHKSILPKLSCQYGRDCSHVVGRKRISKPRKQEIWRKRERQPTPHIASGRLCRILGALASDLIVPRRYRDTALDAKVSTGQPLDKTAQRQTTPRSTYATKPVAIPHGTYLIEG